MTQRRGPNRWIYTHRRWRRLRALMLGPGVTCHWRLDDRCTVRATVLDHVIDTNTIERGDPIAWDPRYIVPSCRICNAIRGGQRSQRLARRRRRLELERQHTIDRSTPS
jgi:hypothetical protein